MRFLTGLSGTAVKLKAKRHWLPEVKEASQGLPSASNQDKGSTRVLARLCDRSTFWLASLFYAGRLADESSHSTSFLQLAPKPSDGCLEWHGRFEGCHRPRHRFALTLADSER